MYSVTQWSLATVNWELRSFSRSAERERRRSGSELRLWRRVWTQASEVLLCWDGHTCTHASAHTHARTHRPSIIDVCSTNKWFPVTWEVKVKWGWVGFFFPLFFFFCHISFSCVKWSTSGLTFADEISSLMTFQTSMQLLTNEFIIIKRPPRCRRYRPHVRTCAGK